MDSLVSSEKNLKKALQQIPENCDTCLIKLSIWKNKTPKAFLLSLGALKKVDIPVKWCPSCFCAFYPELYSQGIVFLHNKIMLTIDLLMDLINVLKTGASMIETISQRIKLLGCIAGFSTEEMETDLNNTAIKVEKATIALASILIGVDDLDDVCCYLCGACPKIVSSGTTS